MQEIIFSEGVYYIGDPHHVVKKDKEGTTFLVKLNERVGNGEINENLVINGVKVWAQKPKDGNGLYTGGGAAEIIHILWM